MEQHVILNNLCVQMYPTNMITKSILKILIMACQMRTYVIQNSIVCLLNMLLYNAWMARLVDAMNIILAMMTQTYQDGMFKNLW